MKMPGVVLLDRAKVDWEKGFGSYVQDIIDFIRARNEGCDKITVLFELRH